MDKEKKKERYKEWAKKNRCRLSEYHLEYIRSHKKQKSESAKKYYQKNKEKVLLGIKNYKAMNAEKINDSRRNNRLIKDFGITNDIYEKIFIKQGGVCKICGLTNKDGRRLSVDHCHETGVIRGLLCGRCNLGIGMLGDTHSHLIKVLEYLKTTKSSVEDLLI